MNRMPYTVTYVLLASNPVSFAPTHYRAFNVKICTTLMLMVSVNCVPWDQIVWLVIRSIMCAPNAILDSDPARIRISFLFILGV